MSKQPDVYLELALRALERVPRFLAERTLHVYLKDEFCQAAVERQLEIAGDALGHIRKLSPELFARIPEGALIVAFRNVLAHGYATLDHERVYDAATSKVTTLAATIRNLLNEIPPGQ
ncbi:MAG: HepT-like ribonuclease domain-containing protein [Steroidobacteraceae bacterium]